MREGGSRGADLQRKVAEQSEDVTAALTTGLEVLQRAHALNPLKLSTLEALEIAYEFVKQPDERKRTEDKIKALRVRYPDLPKATGHGGASD